MTWAVYSDREFDFEWVLAFHTALIFVASTLLLAARFGSDSGPDSGDSGGRVIHAATTLYIVALAAGTVFAIVEFSAAGVPLMIVPAAALTVLATVGSSLTVWHNPRL